jgi:hypothetical protein
MAVDRPFVRRSRVANVALTGGSGGGATGASGSNGATGATGSNGATGATGAGVTGATGSASTTGATLVSQAIVIATGQRVMVWASCSSQITAGVTSTATYKITRNGTQLGQAVFHNQTNAATSQTPVSMFALDIAGVAGTQTFNFVGTTSGVNGDISAIAPEMMFAVTTV